MALSRESTYLHDAEADAALAEPEWGRTERFSTGLEGLDHYLYGGYGKKWGWEVLVVFGPTKSGKSTFCLNLLATAVAKGEKVGLMALEDQAHDIYHRVKDVIGADAQAIIRKAKIQMIPKSVKGRAWKLPELLELIEHWFLALGIDLILVDHLQFVYENAETVKGDNVWDMQRKFMQEVNFMMSRMQEQKPNHSATLILVSHINKDTSAKGTNKISGSGGIAAAATKIIELTPAAGGLIEIKLHPSRYTAPRDGSYLAKLDGAKLAEWDGKL